MILGRQPEDWDITTSAHPHEIKNIFKRTVDTGIQHGTVTVLIDHLAYEITTYRIDGEYEDYRRPKNVEFVSDLVEDLRRRDFTINAMAYNPKEGLIDAFGGVEDLERKLIRCVGVPEERFSEDALRILRAVRFSAQLTFDIDIKTKKAVTLMAENLVNISKERIQVELDKLLMSDNPGKIKEAYELGITKYIFPEFDQMMQTSQNTIYHEYSVGEHSVKVLENIKKDHYLRWSALLHDVGKPDRKSTDERGNDHFYGHDEVSSEIAYKILRDLRFDNKTINYVSRIVKHHGMKIKGDEVSVRKSIHLIGEDIYEYFLELRRADLEGKSNKGKEGSYEKYLYIKETYEKIINNNDCLTLKCLAIKGADLIAMGIKPGEAMGTILENLLELVLENPSLNEKNRLLSIVKETTNI